MIEMSLVWVAFIVVTLGAIIASTYMRGTTTHSVTEVKPHGREYILEITSERVRFGKVIETRRKGFRGSGTVFNELETGRRARSLQEWILCDALKKFQWEEEDDRKPAV